MIDLCTFKISLRLTLAFNLIEKIFFIKFGLNPLMGLKTPKAMFLALLIYIDGFPPNFTVIVFDSVARIYL